MWLCDNSSCVLNKLDIYMQLKLEFSESCTLYVIWLWEILIIINDTSRVLYICLQIIALKMPEKFQAHLRSESIFFTLCSDSMANSCNFWGADKV